MKNMPPELPDIEDINAKLKRLKSTISDDSLLVDELKKLNQNPHEYWYAIGSQLQKVLKEQLYLAAGYKSFSDYCARALGYSRQHVYKLMRMVHFIDQQWSQARSPEQLTGVKRLFSLGFTKIYLIHSLPSDTIDRLLKEGVEVSKGDEQLKVKLEAISTKELKRMLAHKKHSGGLSPSQTKPVAGKSLGLLTQIKMLFQLVEQCQRDLDNPEALANQLENIKKHATAMLADIDTHPNNTVQHVQRDNGGEATL
jgi:hypothetical protein